ncbi:MAG TPA: ubiquinol-cytochrome c reductase iron-sulfur subunit [Dehalococcoidia bacterium]|nr:ubiquinol-cytochrome c reductase iron-sulfur subunit [Dehalococcoidia bacterium]
MKKVLNRLLHFMRVLYGLVVVLLALMRMVQPAPEQLQPPLQQAASRNETEPKPQEPESPARRRLMIGGIGLVGAAISGAIGVPVVAFFVAPLLQKPAQEWRDVGPVDSFKVGSITEVKLADPAAVAWSGATEQQGVWLRRVDATQFQAFSINCTHLGCPVHWIDTARLFMCPCHGGVFYEDGRVAAPPPARPLEQHQVRIADSHVQVLTHELAITGHFPHLGK